jgi:hypothetical protein
MNDDNNPNGFFMDDGTPVNTNFLKKPSLCVTCKKDDDQSESIFCNLTRMDQQGEAQFICDAYQSN